MPSLIHQQPIIPVLLLIIIIQFVQQCSAVRQHLFLPVFAQWSRYWLELVINQLLRRVTGN